MFKRLTGKEFNQFLESKKSDISKKKIAAKVGMSPTGLHESIRDDKMKLSMFQDVCEVVGVHPACFFILPGQSMEDIMAYQTEVAEPPGAYQQVTDQVPRILYDEMKKRFQDEIAFLREEVKRKG